MSSRTDSSEYASNQKKPVHHMLANDCPHCGAQRGERCTTPSGFDVFAHAVRPRGFMLADLTPATYAAWEELDADPFATEVISPTEFIVL